MRHLLMFRSLHVGHGGVYKPAKRDNRAGLLCLSSAPCSHFPGCFLWGLRMQYRSLVVLNYNELSS